MPVALQFGAECYERLHVASAADDLDDDVEVDGVAALPLLALGVDRGRGRGAEVREGGGWCAEDAREGAAEFGVEVDVDAAIVCGEGVSFWGWTT